MLHHFIVVIHNRGLLILGGASRSARAAGSGHFDFFHDILFVNAGKVQRDSTDTLHDVTLSRGIIAELLKLDTIYWQILLGLRHEPHLYYIEYLISSNQINMRIGVTY